MDKKFSKIKIFISIPILSMHYFLSLIKVLFLILSEKLRKLDGYLRFWIVKDATRWRQHMTQKWMKTAQDDDVERQNINVQYILVKYKYAKDTTKWKWCKRQNLCMMPNSKNDKTNFIKRCQNVVIHKGRRRMLGCFHNIKSKLNVKKICFSLKTYTN